MIEKPERETVTEYRLGHVQEALTDLKQQMSAYSLSINTSIGALTGQLHTLVESLPDRFPTRREYEAALDSLRSKDQEGAAEARSLRASLDAAEARDSNRSWAFIGALVAALIALVLGAINLVSRMQ